MRRRDLLAVAAAALPGCTALGSPSGGDGVIDPGPTVGVEPVASVGGALPADVPRALRIPVDLAVDPGSGRTFVATRAGVVLELAAGGPRPVLDVRDRVHVRGERTEQGMFGVALHPEFERNGRLFVRYSAPPGSETPEHYAHTGVLAAFRIGDGAAASAASERRLLAVPEPGKHHNGGAVAFGPDGYLYCSYGDGKYVTWGAAGEEFATDAAWRQWTRGGYAQDVASNLLGSVLRIDVDAGAADGADGRPYGVPDDNPLVGRDGRDEYYAWGFRNPWRMSFDGRGRLFVADVGQGSHEEVNLVERGGNYGWNVKEGSDCFNGTTPLVKDPWCPDESAGGERFVDPVIEYTQEVRTGLDGREAVGVSVIGGYVYEGSAIPALAGEYVFGDLSGRLFVASPADERPWPIRELGVGGAGDRFNRPVYGFGRGTDGELYVLSSPEILKLVPP